MQMSFASCCFQVLLLLLLLLQTDYCHHFPLDSPKLYVPEGSWTQKRCPTLVLVVVWLTLTNLHVYHLVCLASFALCRCDMYLGIPQGACICRLLHAVLHAGACFCGLHSGTCEFVSRSCKSQTRHKFALNRPPGPTLVISSDLGGAEDGAPAPVNSIIYSMSC